MADCCNNCDIIIRRVNMASNYQPGYDVERFEKTVDQNFHCLVCYNVLKDPVMCWRNGHCFCRGCITEHLRRNAHSCPTCADELTVETLQDVPRFVKNYLNELNIRCDHYERGCRELVQLQNLQRHVAECGFSPVLCQNQGCGETISKRDRTYHETELCQFRKLQCHNCGEISTMMAGMEINMANFDTKITNLNTNQADMRTKVDNMSTEILEVKTSIVNVNALIGHTNTKLENMNTKMANVEAKFEAVNDEVRGMRSSLNEVRDGFETLKEAVLERLESKERKQENVIGASGAASGKRENQHIFVAGGFGENSVEIFNYRKRLWSSLKPMPEDRYCASSFVYNNDVTLAGGWCGLGPVDNIIRMNIQPAPDLTINWSDFAAKLPAKMCGHCGVVYKDSLFVSGGYDADHNVISDSIYEIQLNPPYAVKLVSKMPGPRADHCAVVCDDNIFIFGGKKSWFSKDNVSSVLRFDIKKHKFQQLPELPYAVSQMAVVKWAENVVIIGGADRDEKTLNKVMIYNTKTGNSHMLPPMLNKRRGCAAVVIESTIVALGGRYERRNNVKSVEGFSFERFSWEKLPDMKEARFMSTAVVI